MHRIVLLFLLTFAVTFCTIHVHAFGVGQSEEDIYLTRHQGQTIVLDCAEVRSGTVRLSPPEHSACPDSNFHVNIRVKYGPRCRGYFRFYINVRKLHLGENDLVTIHDSMYGQRFGRLFFGQHKANISTGTQAESVSQFLSKQDSVRIEYNREGECNSQWVSSTPAKDVVLDFTLIQLHKDHVYDDYFCPSLQGYVPRIVFCANDSRVTCPDHFQWQSYIPGLAASAFNYHTFRRCKDQWIPEGAASQHIPHHGHHEHHDQSDHHDHSAHHPDASRTNCWKPPAWIPFPVNPRFIPCNNDNNNGQQPQQDQQDIDENRNPETAALRANPDLLWADVLPDTVNEKVTTEKPHKKRTKQTDTPDIPDMTDTPHKKRTKQTDTPDIPDLPDITGAPEYTDSPEIDEPVTEVIEEPDEPEVDDDPEPQKPWRVVPLKSKRRKVIVIDHNDNQENSHHHHWYPNLKHNKMLYTVLYTSLVVLAVVFTATALCFWCARRRGYVMYQHISTTSPTAPPPGYGTFEGPRGGYYAGHTPAMTTPVMMVAPSHPYLAHEVKIHPNPN